MLGPGLLAGLSDDDPAGITTYSVLGADNRYQLLWVLLLSTVALVLFHGLAARMGVVTGQGLIGLVRQRYGVRVGAATLAALVVANVGTTCAEFAGIAAGSELFGISRYVSVPISAALVSVLVLRGSSRRVEHLLLALSTVFLAYIASGMLARPDWGPPCTACWYRRCRQAARPLRLSPPPSEPRWLRGDCHSSSPTSSTRSCAPRISVWSGSMSSPAPYSPVSLASSSSSPAQPLCTAAVAAS